jgi:hypothetical protein
MGFFVKKHPVNCFKRKNKTYMQNIMAIAIGSQKKLERYHGIDKIIKLFLNFP